MKHSSALKLQAVLAPLSTFVVLTTALELGSRTGWMPSYILPPPSEVLKALFIDSNDLWVGFKSTVVSSLTGWALSAIVGILVSMLMSLSGFLKRALLPYAVFFQTVPIIALAPVLVIWFGFGQPTVIASSFIVSVFPVIASTLAGLRSVDEPLVDLFRILKATRLQMLLKLQLPAALPSIFTGLRVAAGLAVIGVIVGEFIAGGGLGEVVDAARTQQRLDRVFAAVLLSSILGLLMISTLNGISRLMLKAWHSSERVDSSAVDPQ